MNLKDLSGVISQHIVRTEYLADRINVGATIVRGNKKNVRVWSAHSSRACENKLIDWFMSNRSASA